MNPQPEEDLQRRLQNLEAEINSRSGGVSQSSQQTGKPSPSRFSNYKVYITRFVTWFQNLTTVKKLIVAVSGFLVGFAILQAVFKLVTAVISLAVLGILVYVGYKFFVSSNSQTKQ